MSKIDKTLLATCMGEMYSDTFAMYREYVQNACDATDDAQKAGLIDNITEKMIVITIKPASRTVQIMDRGIGVNLNEIESCLVDLGYSKKRNKPSYIGQYGIGRLIGAHYCEKITYETSASGEGKKSIVTFDAKKAWEIVNSDEDCECWEAIDKVTTVNKDMAEEESEHYFRVLLEGINNDELLDEKKVAKYLAETAPIDYSFEFKDDVLNPALAETTEYKDLFKSLNYWPIQINGKDIRKLYEPSVQLTPIEELSKVEFMRFDHGDELLAWGWCAMSKTAKQMNNIAFRGIRLREHNMAIGDSRRSYDLLSYLFPKPVDYNYFVGEIFIVSPKIKPSTSRDGLDDNVERQILYRQIEKKFASLKKQYETVSRFSSKIVETATNMMYVKKYEKQISQTNDEDEKKAVNKNLESAKVKLNSSLDEATKYADKLKSDFLQQVAQDIVKNAEKKVNEDITAYNKKKDVQANNGQLSNVNLDNVAAHVFHKEEVEKNHEEEENKKEDENNAPKKTSELDAYKGLSENEIKVIKAVYSVLNSFKSIPPTIMEKIKNKLVKKLVKNA